MAPAARVAAANALLDRGYGKPIQPISQTVTKVDPSTLSDEELAAIVSQGATVNSPGMLLRLEADGVRLNDYQPVA